MQERRTLIWYKPRDWALAKEGLSFQSFKPPGIWSFDMSKMPKGELVNMETRGRWRRRRRYGPRMPDPPRIGVLVFEEADYFVYAADTVIRGDESDVPAIYKLPSYYFVCDNTTDAIRRELKEWKEGGPPAEEPESASAGIFSSADFGF